MLPGLFSFRPKFGQAFLVSKCILGNNRHLDIKSVY